MFPFAEESQSQKRVTLKGEALKRFSGAQGIYILQPYFVNGKTYWFQKNGKFAIWYLSEDVSETYIWALGRQERLGSTRLVLASPDEVTDPQEATTWDFKDGTNPILKSTNPGDVIVANIPNSKNLRSIKMKSMVIPWAI